MLKILIQLFHDLVHRNAPGCAGISPQYAPRPLPKAGIGRTKLPEITPRLSIVIPSFNQGEYLEQAIRSVLDQCYPNLELIVVDGGSTDNSVSIIKQYAKQLKWWVSEPDSGQAEAINKGMQHATGEILAWLNSDDMLMPGSLFIIARHLEESPTTDVVYGHRVLVNETGEDVGKWILPRHDNFILSYADYIPQETLYWRRRIWQETGARVDERYQFAMDWEMLNRFVTARARFHRIPAFLGQFRIHPGQKSSALIEKTGFDEMEKIRIRYLDRFSNPLQRWCITHLRMLNLAVYMLRAKWTELGLRWGVIELI